MVFVFFPRINDTDPRGICIILRPDINNKAHYEKTEDKYTFVLTIFVVV
jgi:hypothetical protein